MMLLRHFQFKKLKPNSTDWIPARQLATIATLVNCLATYLCCLMFQPADNKQVHPINIGYVMEIQTHFPLVIPQLVIQLYCSHTQPDSIFAQGHYRLQFKQDCFYCKRQCSYAKIGSGHAKLVILHYTPNDNRLLQLRSVRQMVTRRHQSTNSLSVLSQIEPQILYSMFSHKIEM